MLHNFQKWSNKNRDMFLRKLLSRKPSLYHLLFQKSASHRGDHLFPYLFSQKFGASLCILMGKLTTHNHSCLCSSSQIMSFYPVSVFCVTQCVVFHNLKLRINQAMGKKGRKQKNKSFLITYYVCNLIKKKSLHMPCHLIFITSLSQRTNCGQ